ncbi:MAG: DUF1648 domain-containing protein [Firmicutes bacterium]|nr:DUF1648 domain-containing protein [Bacillota bacterium]
MATKRPKIKIPLTKLDIYLEFLTGLILAVNFFILVLNWFKLPKAIPSHFNFLGEIDAYGDKNILLLLLLLVLALYILLSVISKFPHIYNYPVEITEENAEKQYRNAIRLMRIMKFVMVAIFTYIQYAIIKSALNQKSELDIWFLPVFLIAIFLPVGYYTYKSIKNKT